MSETLQANLTETQQLFLNVRMYRDSDRASAREVGVSPQTVSFWKKDAVFRQAYQAVVQGRAARAVAAKEAKAVVDLESQVQDVVLPQVDVSDMSRLVQTELEANAGLVRKAFHRLASIIEYGSDSQALKAAEVVGKWYGIGPERLAPDKMTLVQQNILQMFGGEQDGESNSQDSERVIDGEFSTLPSDK